MMSSTPPPQPPEDGSGINGKCTRRYQLRELKSYTAVRRADSVTTTLFYYQGRLLATFLGDRLLDEEEDASFLCFDTTDMDRASSIFRCSNEINDSRSLRCHFLTFNEEIRKYLICSERIDGFFEDNTDFLNLRKERSSSMPMHPHPKVQTEIVGITAGINRMHLKGISNSRFDSTSSYVWCKGHLKTFGDYFRADTMGNNAWNGLLKIHLGQFKNFLDLDLLKSDDDWAQKNSFLRCFGFIHNYPSEEKSLNMIILHPFLMGDQLSYMEYFSRIGHAVYHRRINGTDNGFNVEPLFAALQSGILDNDICTVRGRSTGTWIRSNMHKEFKAMVQAVEKTDQAYCERSAEGLLTFLYDVYENYDTKMKLDEVYQEVEKHWPCFIDRLHEYV